MRWEASRPTFLNEDHGMLQYYGMLLCPFQRLVSLRLEGAQAHVPVLEVQPKHRSLC